MESYSSLLTKTIALVYQEHNLNYQLIIVVVFIAYRNTKGIDF